jgi:FixJ family two-component response regulator
LYKGTQYKNEAIRSFGAADYFEKPFDNEKLVKSVLNLLHDEMDIQEDLPDPESVLKLLSDDDESKDS